MSYDKNFFITLRVRWLTVMFIDFIFGIGGVIISSFELYAIELESHKRTVFFSICLTTAFCLICSALIILIAVIKKDDIFAFSMCIISFSILSAVAIFIEVSMSSKIIFAVLFSVFAICFIGCFSIYSYIQIVVTHQQKLQMLFLEEDV